MFFTCTDKNKENYLQFSYLYHSKDIAIEGLNLRSYIIDIWYYPDLLIEKLDKVRKNSYVFYSNSIFAYKTDAKNLQIGVIFGPSSKAEGYHNREWNKLIFKVIFEDSNRYTFSAKVNGKEVKNLGYTVDPGQGNLTQIIFCNGCTKGIGTINWAEGFYKSLRIWNADLISDNALNEIDRLYPDETLIKGLSALERFYPLKGKYIRNNCIQEIQNGDNEPCDSENGDIDLENIDSSTPSIFYRKYNFGSNFDYIFAEKKEGNFLVQDSFRINSCDSNCKRCWSSEECYECEDGFFLSNGICKSTSYNYFQVPSSKYSKDIYIGVPGFSEDDDNAITITFWVKPFNFPSNGNLFYYNDNTFLTYSSNMNDNDNYGLALKYYSGSSLLTFSVDHNFREKIGIWNFISLSYHSQKNYIFPRMMQFEINNLSFDSDFSKLKQVSIGTYFKIPYGLYALFAEIKIYNSFIIGTYGFEKYIGEYTNPFSKPSNSSMILFSPSESLDGCYSDYLYEKDGSEYKIISKSSNPFTCVPDIINSGEDLSSNDCSKCQNVCYNSNELSCSCMNKNFQSQLLLKKSTEPLRCKRLIYPNFAKARSFTIPNITSARLTKKFTMQFWMYAYNYFDGTFKGVTWTWLGHNKIKIESNNNPSSLNEYKFYCFPKESISTSISTTIIINKWNFISCAADYKEKKVYLTVNPETGISPEVPPLDFSETYDYENDITTLTFSDDYTGSEEYGVLFFNQIRLWKEAYFNTDFLSRINLTVPTRFPNLLHGWSAEYRDETDVYKNPYLKDITDKTNSNNTHIILEYPTDVLGFNYLLSDSIVKLCSDNGYYYDSLNEECVPFTDVSKINSLEFKVPNSYSGTYTMSFWIFLEDASYISIGIHFTWKNHLQITLYNNGLLTAICFPQEYYSSKYDNNQIDTKYNNVKSEGHSADSFSGLYDLDESPSGNWIYVACAVSNYAEKFIIYGKSQSSEDFILQKEKLFTSRTEDDDNDQEYFTEYPMKYFFSDRTKTPSTFKIENLKNSAKIYFRAIYLFRDFIPKNYNFIYHDLSKITNSEMPSLLFVCNFAEVTIESSSKPKITIKYHLFEQNTTSIRNYYKDSSKKITITLEDSEIPLSANFIFLPLCDFTKNQKYEKGCVGITNCPQTALNAKYCMDEYKAFVCLPNFYINPSETNVTCTSHCKIRESGSVDKDYMRIPGTMEDKGICSIEKSETIQTSFDSSAKLKNYDSNFQCSSGVQIDYKCKTVTNSALFYSRCYNLPNFYVAITNTVKQKISRGYLLEFWFKFDYSLFFCAHNEKEYYFYSTPHSIYQKSSAFYYGIIGDESKNKQLNNIHSFEWNKIVIKTTLGSSSGQSVIIYVNYNFDETANITGIPDSTNMQLSYISFCSNPSNGKCVDGSESTNIYWGSAYYSNIRVWDLLNSDILTVQAFNNKFYEYDATNYPTSLIMYYPLTINYIDKNNIQDIISGLNIKVTHSYTLNFDTTDNFIFYNYETNFDWSGFNEGKYITAINDGNKKITFGNCHENCKRCFSSSITDCYECTTNNVLVGKECKPTTNYFLRTPNSITLKSDLINTFNEYTISFWMKFLGVVSSSHSLYPSLLLLDSNLHMDFDTKNHNLVFTINSDIPYSDSNFRNYYGKWIHIAMASYISDNTTVFPHMFTWSVNNIDIPHNSDYTLPINGIKISSLTFGGECIVLYSNLHVYNKFIQGVYGKVMRGSESDNDSETTSPYYVSLYGTKEECVPKSVLVNPDSDSVSVSCISDYNPYIVLNCNQDASKYFDPDLSTNCGSCNTTFCKTCCTGSTMNDCTCNLKKGQYWLRKHKTTRKTYCENLPYIDFSVLEDISIQVPSSITCESTLEFWLYVYSYNTAQNNFKHIEIIWDLHSAVIIDIKSNGLNVICYPVYSQANPDQYTEQITLSMTAFRWNLIRCGANMASAEKKFFFNSNSMDLVADCPSERINTPYPTNLNIKSTKDPHSFGYIFIKNLKLFQEYNFKYIDTSYIAISSIGEYNEETSKSTGKYPSLISYFKNELKPDDYINTERGLYTLINELGHDNTATDDPYKYHKTSNWERILDFRGYNYIDPKNEGYYSDLITCQEGSVFNSATNTCSTPTLTHCGIPGDISDNCISCEDLTPYLFPEDGSCLSECPVGYYPDDNMMRCRPCEATCYTCTGRFNNDCTSCIGDNKLIENEGLCVTNCEQYDLTKSSVDPNKCTEFDADAVLINVQEGVPIDVNNFHEIVAKVTIATSSGYTTKWELNEDKTREINDDPDMTFDTYPWTDAGTEHEANEVEVGKEFTTPLDTTFFQLDKYYAFDLQIIKTNISHSVTYTKSFILTMNKKPSGGSLTTEPTIGLYNTTTFVITCGGWSDDTTETENLEYYFYSIEDRTSTQKLLSDWSTVNEITSNFTVIYYQQENSTIKIYCKIRDNYGAITELDTDIVIANKLSGTTYKLYDAISHFSLPEEVDTELLYHKSQYLMTLGIDTYKTLQPELFQTKYDPALDATVITQTEPTCTSDYCNSYGECSLIDEFLVCNCENGHLGRNCHIATHGYDLLENAYTLTYEKLISLLQSTINYEQFMVIHNLYFGASQFIQDEKFFSEKLETFLTLAMNLFTDSILNNTSEYIDLIDYYYSYTLDRLNKKRIEQKVNSGYPYKNVTLEEDQVTEFKSAFDYISTELNTFLKYLAQQYLNTQKTITYESKNFYLALASVNPTFDEEIFFNLRKKNYKSSIQFMKCLTYIEVEKLTNPYFQAWLIYIEYNRFPYSYNKTLNPNNTSPMIEIRFLDGTTGKDITVSGCTNDNAILIEMPFTSYNWLDELNRQKWLHDPNNYKSPSDPIFKDPIYINKSGFISNDTIEQRIEKYNRVFNISGMYYDTQLQDFNQSGINYVNFTSDTNFIQFTSDHLTKFTSFFIENNPTFTVENRFFYIKRPQVMKWFPNYTNNKAFFILGGFIGLYLLLVIILSCYDNRYFQQESLLEFLKKEIIKANLAYVEDKEEKAVKAVPIAFNPDPQGLLKKNLNDGILVTDDKLNINEKSNKSKLKLNKFESDIEDENNIEKITDTEQSEIAFNKKKRRKSKSKKKRKSKNYEENIDEAETDIKKNTLINIDEMIPTQSSKKEDNKYNSKEEYEKRLSDFSKINLPMKKFLKENILSRHIIISPIINVSLFHPRWKKLTMVVTQISIMSLMISLLLTNDEKITNKNIGGCVKVGIISLLISDTIMYILAFFFQFSRKQRYKLLNLVNEGKQLAILKEWEEITCQNSGFTVIGLFIHYFIWGLSFYISIAFVAVWSVQSSAYVIAIISAFAFDFIIFEITAELIIALLYLGREHNVILRIIAEFLNRCRNYRCLWP